jgi:hypothetical protein
MPDLREPHNPRDPAQAVGVMLIGTHKRNAFAPLEPPSEEGIFPAAIFRKPRPVVGDTRCLCEDIAYACRNDRRTVLVTATNQQIIRLFCSAHVIGEILEHHAVFSSEAKMPVRSEDFLLRFASEYLPLLRVVADDGVPVDWLSPAEQKRLAILAASDTDDIPSVKLALASRGLYLSKDKPALRAVYGAESDLVEHAEWLERLRAGGDAAELERFMDSSGRFTYLSGYGVVKGAQRAYDLMGPWSILAGAVGAYGLWQWLSEQSRQSLRSGLGRFVEFCAELMIQQRAHEQCFDAALPSVPTLGELALHNSANDVLGRACIHALAREPDGHLSAQELAGKVRRQLPCADARVRTIVRDVPCFSQVRPGRWQIGSDYSRRLSTPTGQHRQMSRISRATSGAPGILGTPGNHGR